MVVPENTQKPTDGKTYYWVTSGQWYFSCLSTTANGVAGEGFLAVAPDGTRYWFDWIVSWPATQITKPPFAPPVEPALQNQPLAAEAAEGPMPLVAGSAFLRRDKVSIYPTKIQDRFGNTVTYVYDNTVKTRLLSITASDGRVITLSYDANGRVQSVFDGTRTWNYTYGPTGNALTEVVLPDASKWQFNLAPLSALYANDSLVDPDCWSVPMNPTQTAQTGTITHPSGAIGTFTYKPTLHGRSYANLSCVHSIDGLGGDFFFSIYPYLFSSLSLQSKKIEGPGLPSGGYTWNYTYGPPNNSEADCSGCVDTKTVVVQGPDDWVRFTFSNRFQQGEGKLVKTETGTSAASILRTETSAYRIDPAGQAYPPRIGQTPFTRSDRTSEKHAPNIQRQIVQQGTTFTWQVNQNNGVYQFDAYANPLSVTRSSTPGGYTRTDVSVYDHNTAKWVIGQVAKSTNTNSGLIESEIDYDNNTALPLWAKAFGKLRHTLAYNPDGTLLSVKDGNNRTTTYSDWMRGLPQKVTFADAKFKSAEVNNIGGIDSVTDENGYTTRYGYDAMGRLSLIDYPDGDTVNWANTTRSFAIAGSAYGLPAGHWQQVVITGNARQVTHFDALWRPVVVATYDAADTAGTLSQTVTRYDSDGRPTFVSYPQRSQDAAVYNTWGNPAVAPNALGTDSAYDVLGRITSVQQDSELGVLTTSTAYASDANGAYIRITNPRTQQTRIWHQAFDTPSQDAPVAIQEPGGKYTDIVRDVFGKPKTITRRNTDSTLTIARRYYYDTYQQLCRTMEPETGSTVMQYDDAGNLAWSAAGLDLPTTDACYFAQGDQSGRRVDRTYNTRNRLKTLAFPDDRGNQSWTYTADGLPDTIVTNNGGVDIVTNRYTYNRRRLLEDEQLSWGSVDWTLGYTYNGNGHLSSQTAPIGGTVSYTPNALGQPTQVGDYATGVSYFPNGAAQQFTYGNGIVHTLTQNDRGLPERSRDVYGGVPRLDDSYDYDENGNVAGISDATTGHRGDRTMTYDGLDRLTDVVSPMYGATGAHYTYDVLDNLIKVQIGGTAARTHYYCYDAAWRLTNLKTGSCAGTSVIGLGYDVQGNLANKNGTAFGFDYGNRLRSVSTAPESKYVYDGHGRRVNDEVGADKNSFYGQNGQLAFVSDLRLQQYSNYYYLNGSLVAIRDKPFGQDAVVKYQHTDALGSPVAVTDANRVVIEKNEYEPFGKVINHPLKDGPGYTGHVSDATTSMLYMQERYDDPGLGRTLSVDPVTAHSTGDYRYFNRYAYAFNNPYTFKDPDGRCPNCVTGGIGAGIGLLVGLGIEGYRQYRTGEFKVRSLLVEGGKGAVVGGLIGLTGGAAAAGGLTLSGQAAATGSVALGVGTGAHAVGEVAKGNPAPSASDSIKVGYATAAGAIAGTALSPATKSVTTTVIPAVSSHPVTSLSGKTFNTVNIPAQVIERPAAAEVANNVAGSVVEDLAKKREEGQ